MQLPSLIPYQTQLIDVPMSVEEAEQLLQISSDPENGFASLIGVESPEGWLVTRRPGLLNNLMFCTPHFPRCQNPGTPCDRLRFCRSNWIIKSSFPFLLISLDL